MSWQVQPTQPIIQAIRTIRPLAEHVPREAVTIASGVSGEVAMAVTQLPWPTRSPRWTSVSLMAASVGWLAAEVAGDGDGQAVAVSDRVVPPQHDPLVMSSGSPSKSETEQV